MSLTTENSGFRQTKPGIERLRGLNLPRHRHLRAYASVVLAGSFVESGYNGRIVATAGDVLIHPAMDCHDNQMITAGVTLVRLDWLDSTGIGGLFRIPDADQLARVAACDATEAAHRLRRILEEQCLPALSQKNDWPDLLLADMVKDTDTVIGNWAEINGLARETVSRGFAMAYGISPSSLRAELRTRAAWLRITRGTAGLCSIAAETGFADQAHMTRWVHRITGAPPTAWRRRDFTELLKAGS